jgi:DNA-directed RNA polymerase specialized sigma24 family protein
VTGVSRRPVDLAAVLASLPRDHLVVLRGAMAGFAAPELAVLAGVPVEAVVPLLRLATAKLVTALAEPPTVADDEPAAPGRRRT